MNTIPVRAPLAGVEEAVDSMEQVMAHRQRKRYRTAGWTFFTANGDYVDAPCLCCARRVSPVATRWWHGICKWDRAQRKRAREIGQELGMEAEEEFAVTCDDMNDNDVRAAVYDAWKARHPDVEASWNEACTRFVLRWEQDVE